MMALLAVAAGLLLAVQPAPPPPNDALPLPGEPAALPLPAEPAALPVPPAPAVGDPPAAAADSGDEASRVVRGTPVPAGGSPWQIQLYTTLPIASETLEQDRRRRPSDPEKRYYDRMAPWERDHLCGGALIGDGWALTAAHCLVNTDETLTWKDLKELRVRLGNVHLPAATEMAVDRVVVHRGYKRSGDKRHDIALLHLVADAATNKTIAQRARPIPLATPGSVVISPDSDVVATGWGVTRENRQGLVRDISAALLRGSPDLLEASLKIVSPQDCRRIASYRATIGPGVICAVGATALRQDTCQGDSGGPLTRLGRLVGLVSTGEGCGRPGVPAIYTRVDAYADWIRLAQARSPPGRISRCSLVGRDRLQCS